MLRTLLALCLLAWTIPTQAGDILRIGLQKTGTFAWQLDVIRRHDLAAAAGLDLKITEYATSELKVSLLSKDVALITYRLVQKGSVQPAAPSTIRAATRSRLIK